MSNEHRKTRGRTRPQASFPVAETKNLLPTDYATVLQDLKERIRSERLRVTLSANAAMVLLYWDIGCVILKRQQQQGWGAKVIDRLSTDLQDAFPDMTGLSPRNLKYMRKFAESWPDREIVQRTVAQIPWRSNLALLDKLKNNELRLWYTGKTIENGWSRDVLVLQIEGRLHEREGKAVPFDPGFVGQLNLYLSAVDDLMKHPDDNPTVGLLLCKSKNKLVVEYALRGLQSPMGVAQWQTQLTADLPDELKGSLPTIAEIEAELGEEEI